MPTNPFHSQENQSCTVIKRSRHVKITLNGIYNYLPSFCLVLPSPSPLLRFCFLFFLSVSECDFERSQRERERASSREEEESHSFVPLSQSKVCRTRATHSIYMIFSRDTSLTRPSLGCASPRITIHRRRLSLLVHRPETRFHRPSH